MNKITIIGNLTKDPESRMTQTGLTVCTFTVAVNRKFAGSDGTKQTDFFRINAWKALGENCMKYLAKGRKVAVVGELQARMYEGRDGTKQMSLDVQAEEVEFLTPKEEVKSETPKKKKQNTVEDEDWLKKVTENDDLDF